MNVGTSNARPKANRFGMQISQAYLFPYLNNTVDASFLWLIH